MTSEYLGVVRGREFSGVVRGSEYSGVFRGRAGGRRKLEATEFSLVIYSKLKQGRYPFLIELLICVYHLKIF